MANGLTPQQQNQLLGLLQQPTNQGGYGLGRTNAQSFINGGNQSVLGNLASQSTANGGNMGGIGNPLNGIANLVKTSVKGATDVAMATMHDQLGNSSNRISTSAISAILDAVVNGVSDIANLNISAALQSIIGGALGAAKDMMKDLARTQAELFDVTNKSGAFVGELGSNMREEMNDALVNTTKLGATVDDVLKGTEILLTSSGRMALYSKEAITEGVTASLAYTKSSTYLLENSEAFRNVGMGIQDSAKAITIAGQKTLELGLNAKVLTDTLVKNLGKLNEFGFQGGIAGLTRMTQEAQSLNLDMGNAFKIADQLFDPNKAIDMAANLSMIGGAIGDFGDPLRMIYDATNNVEGLQTSLINASKSLAVFDQKSGTFVVQGANLRRAKQMADTFGISMGELTNLAVKANVQFQAMSQIRSIFPEATKEQQEFMKNLSTMKDGKIGISIPEEVAKKFDLVGKFKDGFMEFSEFAKLDSSKRDALIKEQQKIAAMKPEDIARGQFNATTQILNVISAMYILQQNNSRRSDLGKKVKKYGQDFADNLNGVDISSIENTADILDIVRKQAVATINQNSGIVPKEPTQPQLNNSANQLPRTDLNNSTNQSYIDANKKTTPDNTTQNVNITHTITASDSTMDAMTKHWSKNLQSLELIGVKINNKPKSFDSTQKVLKR
jgi:hypothetical protein